MAKGNPTGVKEVTERLFAIEKELKLFDKKIAGEPFWELIRSSVRRKILGEVGVYNKKEAQGIRGMGHLVRLALHVLATSMVRNPLLAGRVDVLFFGMYRRRLQEDGFWHDTYCDPIADALERQGIRCSVIERPPFGRPVPKPAKTKHLSYEDFVEVCSMLARRLGFFRVRFSRDELTELAALERRINGEFGISLDVVGHVREILEKEKSMLPFYRAVLRRAAPKAVVATNLGSRLQLVKACRERGIPLVELQQGALHRYHLESVYGNHRVNREYMPDYYFTYGDFWNRFIALPLERVWSVGFPYYEREAARYRNVERKNNQILFLSQPMVGQQMVRFALELTQALGERYHIVYKLHPDEGADWRTHYAPLLDSAVEVVSDKDRPLYHLFAESTVQVGVSSTALFEGLGFGLPTYLLDAPGVELMPALVEAGSAQLISSPQELRELLEAHEWNVQVPGEEFFTTNALSKTVAALHKIIQTEGSSS